MAFAGTVSQTCLGCVNTRVSDVGHANLRALGHGVSTRSGKTENSRMMSFATNAEMGFADRSQHVV